MAESRGDQRWRVKRRRFDGGVSQRGRLTAEIFLDFFYFAYISTVMIVPFLRSRTVRESKVLYTQYDDVTVRIIRYPFCRLNRYDIIPRTVRTAGPGRHFPEAED